MPADQQAFALRPALAAAAAHRADDQGQLPAAAVVAAAARRANDAGKDLTVLRWMPEGEVPLAPELSRHVQPADGRGDVAGRRRGDRSR